MKTLYIILLSVLPIHVLAAPPISFGYDSNGNMTVRYVATLSRVSPQDSTENVTEEKEDLTPRDSTENGTAEKEDLSVPCGEQKIILYPNPTSSTITISIAELDEKQANVMQLYDVTGKLINSVKIQSDATLLEIKGPPGFYLLNINLGNNTS